MPNWGTDGVLTSLTLAVVPVVVDKPLKRNNTAYADATQLASASAECIGLK